jgi:hypothetical protein
MSNISQLLRINKLGENSKMLLLLGQDRAGDFDWLKKYYSHLETDSMPRPEGAMSATKIRGYVSDNKRGEFNEAYSDILDINSINKLYNDVYHGLSRHGFNPQKKSKKRGGRKTIKRKKTIKKRAKKSKRRIISHY